MSTNGRNGGDDEIMLGESLKSSSEKQTVDDVMLGRAYTPEKSFSVAPRPTEVGELHSTETPEERFVELQRLTDGYLTDGERDMLERAFRFADAAHKGVTRKSGEPYIIHPVEVAIILADLRMDGETLCAALLHDTIEDTDVTYQDVATEFNENVAALVDGVTKITRIEVESLSDKQGATIRKMFVAMSKDIRVIVIKLADRLHNMRTLSALKEDRRIFKARETLEIYAPIAHRLGINSVKWELEDLSFYYLEPNKYKQVSRMVTESRAEREQYLGEVIDTLHDEMKKVNIVCQIMGRPKHLYSIYQKMVNKGKGFSEIYDLIAVRIIVKSVKDCYSALGAVHTLWHPMPGRFKDYIAMPKFNMYQSLHTTVIGPAGRPLEVQIRTEEMHRQSEYGVAAHWRYKEKGEKADAALDQQLAWLRQIMEWQKDMSDGKEFMSLLKSDLDLFAESVYCFTPAGDVKNLPNGSTPIDFAYSIHSAVGNKMIGARANGKLVNIDYVIQNGDRIEIITSQNSKGPSRDWLKIVKSAQAKNKINQWFRNELKEDNITRGKELMAAYCKSRSITLSDLMKPSYMESVMRKYGFRDWDSALAAIGHGGLKEGQVVNKLLDEYNKQHQKEITDEHIMEAAEGKEKMRIAKSGNGIVVKGIHDVAVRFSKCCSPVPGDEIVGFVTRGRGISVHRTDCVNVMNLSETDRARLIEAEWQKSEQDKNERYTVEIKIFGYNRTGLLVDISKIFTERKIDLSSLNCRVNKQGVATILLTFDVQGKEELASLTAKIRQIESVIDIQRTSG